MAPVKPKRSERVGERIRAELMEIFLRGVLRDPRASEVIVTHVRVTDDLRNATVYVRLARGEVRPEEARAAIDALGRARGFLRRELAPRLRLKHQPDLEFAWDEQIDRAERIEQLLQEIAHQGLPRTDAAEDVAKFSPPQLGEGREADASSRRSRARRDPREAP